MKGYFYFPYHIQVTYIATHMQTNLKNNLKITLQKTKKYLNKPACKELNSTMHTHPEI